MLNASFIFSGRIVEGTVYLRYLFLAPSLFAGTHPFGSRLTEGIEGMYSQMRKPFRSAGKKLEIQRVRHPA
jgi:hypothetical protein